MKALLATAALAGFSTVLAAAANAVDVAGAVAAEVAGHAITIREVDERCGEPCARLTDEIRTRKWEGLERLVTAALLEGVPAPAVMSVSDAEVDAYIAERPQDFHGPPGRDRAAVRFFLGRERQRRAERALADRERTKRPPSMRITLDDPSLGNARPERVLAEVAGRRISDGDLEGHLALPLYRLRGARHRERLRILEASIDETVWRIAADEVGTTPEVLRQSITAAAPPVTDEDVDRYFETTVRSRDPVAEKRPDRLRPYLEFHRARAAETDFVANGRARFGVRVPLVGPEPPHLRLGPGPGGWRGSADAPVSIVFLTSYRGETSRAMWRVVSKVATEPGTRLAVRPLLPQWDVEATAVAEAVYCAAAQGRSWELHALAAGDATLADAAMIRAMAERVGIDLPRLEQCLADPATPEAVATFSDEAEALGLSEPPSVLIDGIVYGGMQDVAVLREAVRRGSGERRGRG